MSATAQKQKVVIKRCGNCERLLQMPDNFCRWCGAHQSEGPVTTASIAEWCSHETSPLLADEAVYQSLVSLPLDAPTQDAAATTTGSLRLNRFGILVLAVVIAIPMWLLIILLSPFYAYTSAKAASSQMNVQ